LPRFRIPDRYERGLAGIRKLGEKSVRELREAIEKASLSEPRSLEATLVSLFPGLSDCKDIGEALDALYNLRSSKELSIEELTEDISDAMQASSSADLRLSAEERSHFKEKLVMLLSVKSHDLVAKARDLQTEDERTFCDARILTDLRPIFGKSIADGPEALTIVHLLKLSYDLTGGDDHRNFYVSLDAKDLESLKKVILRAEEKAKSLKEKIKTVRFAGTV